MREQVFERETLSRDEFSSQYISENENLLFDITTIRSFQASKKTYHSQTAMTSELVGKVSVVTPVSLLFDGKDFRMVCLDRSFQTTTFNGVRSIELQDGTSINFHRKSVSINRPVTEEAIQPNDVEKEYNPKRKPPREGKNKPSLEYEKQLVERMCSGDVQARDELLERHLWLANTLSRRYARYNAPDENNDINGVAKEALFKATTRFNSKRYEVYEDFESYAHSRIRTAIRFYIFNNRSMVRPGLTNEKISAYLNMGKFMRQHDVLDVSDFKPSLVRQFQDEYQLSDLALSEVFMMSGGDAGYLDAMDSTLNAEANKVENSYDFGSVISKASEFLDDQEMMVLNLMLANGFTKVPEDERLALGVSKSRFSDLKKQVVYKMGYYFSGNVEGAERAVSTLLKADVDTAKLSQKFNGLRLLDEPLSKTAESFLRALDVSVDDLNRNEREKSVQALRDLSEKVFKAWPVEKELFLHTILNTPERSVRDVALDIGEHVATCNKNRQRAAYRMAFAISGDKETAENAVISILPGDKFTSKFNPDVDTTLRGCQKIGVTKLGLE